jgi:prepilin-type N-terminal cleavage/methylation domain-containing protein
VTRLRDPAGFTLIEVMIAALILIVGAGAAFSLIDSANRNVSVNQARSGGTNLGRELTEFARTTDYDLLQPAQVVAALRKHSRITGTLAGADWTVERRNVDYAITTQVCAFDDPKDGFAATPPPNACPQAAAVPGVTKVDINGDDFRRVTFTLSWEVRARKGSNTQTALIVNPAGGLGPGIDKFTEPAAQIVTTAGDKVSWGGPSTYELTTKTSAASVRWSVDDGVSAGDATPGPMLWGFDWNLGTAFDTSAPWVRDGAYVIQAQAYDSRGVPGEGKLITVYINRHAPGALEDVLGGWNETNNVIDMRWDRYEERDLQGYRVVRLLDGKVVCPAAGNELLATCTDSALPASFTELQYEIYAMDCSDLRAATGCTREGAKTVLTVVKAAAAPADAPTGLTATVVDGKPTLSWTAPATAPNGIQFYRIYRDSGTTVADRYDETVTSSPTYVDPNPGATTKHRYWVTAVDMDFNESAPSAYVDSPPL